MLSVDPWFQPRYPPVAVAGRGYEIEFIFSFFEGNIASCDLANIRRPSERPFILQVRFIIRQDTK